ncbi:hypothetical protein N473_21230 [Pseudoalteromonas luteoviolacea CPMOR-1]|uniref:Uncharacterized protein n=1 Tax=Pseudoalteromonas luteoviolacea CPMOR-1 TaxID=1365248 RepID=A0A162BHB7_9GAMM|nr:hypothetical protein N473_21230 [Pseudoalteromonas luteoviolacea CPMOR-1]
MKYNKLLKTDSVNCGAFYFYASLAKSLPFSKALGILEFSE